jgi:hypothetical protein
MKQPPRYCCRRIVPLLVPAATPHSLASSLPHTVTLAVPAAALRCIARTAVVGLLVVPSPLVRPRVATVGPTLAMRV